MAKPVKQLLIRGDDFLLERHLKVLLTKLVDPATKDFNFNRVSGGHIEVADLCCMITTEPMMADSRTVVVDDFQNFLKDELEILEKVLSRDDLPSHIILISAKADKRLSFYKSFAKTGEIIEFKRLYADKIPGFLHTEAKAMGLSLEPDAAVALVDVVGQDLMMLTGELARLSIAIHPATRITLKHVAEFSAPGVAENIFDLGHRIGARDFSGALVLFEKLVGQGEAVIMVIALITGHFRRLLLAREAWEAGRRGGEMASAMGLPPFIARQYESQVRSFSSADLRRIYGDLMRLSENVRRSRLSDRRYMENFFAGVCLQAA